MSTSLLQIAKRFPDQQTCIQYLERLRFEGIGPYCPKCGSPNVLRKKDGTRIGRWNCKGCGSSFNILSGTMFQGTKIKLQKWFLTIHLMLSSRKGISSYQIAREIDTCQYTAWAMMDRIRREMNHHMLNNIFLRGTIEADETYIGAPSNIRGRGTTKIAVLGAVERNGRVVATVIRTADSETIREFVTRYIPEPDGSRFITDGLNAYRAIGNYIRHEVITRSKGHFKGDIHTNTIEGVWSGLKRARYGAHQSYRDYNTQLYVGEACYRYNTRSDNRAFDTFLSGCFEL